MSRTGTGVWSPPGLAEVTRWARDNAIFVILLVLCVIFALSTSSFLTSRNLKNLTEQSAEPALLACGMTVVIIVGEFDLSVGAILGFAAVVAATVANGAGPAVAVLCALAVGAGWGIINGFLVSRVGIQSFLATLAAQFVIGGLAVYLTAGTENYRVNNFLSFSAFADGTLLGFQYKAWIALACYVIIWLMLSRSRLGKQIFAVGGNRSAARISGVRVRSVITLAFVLSGILAGLAGVIAASDTGVAQANVGIGNELSAIAAVIIGGTSVSGGRGGVWRTLAAVMLLSVVANGFTLLYVSPTYDQLVQGAIILVAIVVDSTLRKRSVR